MRFYCCLVHTSNEQETQKNTERMTHTHILIFTYLPHVCYNFLFNGNNSTAQNRYF